MPETAKPSNNAKKGGITLPSTSFWADQETHDLLKELSKETGKSRGQIIKDCLFDKAGYITRRKRVDDKKEKKTSIKTMSDEDLNKMLNKLQRDENKVLANGAYSHRNEMKKLEAMQYLGAPKWEINNIRLRFKLKRKLQGELIKRTKKEIIEIIGNGRLERLDSKQYEIVRRFCPLEADGEGGWARMQGMKEGL